MAQRNEGMAPRHAKNASRGRTLKSFYAYVRSKHNVRDKVGLLKDNAGNIITQGFLMAEEFSSVFTRENTSSLPVPETKFNFGLSPQT